MNTMRKTMGRMAWVILAGALAGGCRTGGGSGQTAGPYSEADIAGIYRNARDPHEFFLSFYMGPDQTPAFVGANRIADGKTTVLPFDGPLETPLPILQATVGRRPTKILVDTSARDNWTAMDGARAQGLFPLGPTIYNLTPVHVADEVNGYLMVLPSMTLGEFEIASLLFYARGARGGLWPLNRDPRAREVEYVFGMAMLRAFAYVQIDFARRTIVLSAEDPYAPVEDEALAALPIDWTAACLAVKGEMDGKPQTFIIDSAGDFELTMQQPPADLVRQVNVDDLVWRQVFAKPSREYGLARPEVPRIGLKLLSNFRITIDNRRNILYFEKPTEIREAPWMF